MEGATKQLESDGHMRRGEVGIIPPYFCPEDILHTALDAAAHEASGKYRDDITGQVLVDALIGDARRLELDDFHDKGMWELRERGGCHKRTGRPPVTVRWVDVNKGDDINTNYRSRLVARQMRYKGTDSIFAGTPPLEAVRTALSLAAAN